MEQNKSDDKMIALEPSSGLQTCKEQISRKNHDGTLIIMKMDATAVFYKIDGIAAEVYLDVFAGSDIRLKIDVNEMHSTLSSIKKLDAILYRWSPGINNHLTTHPDEQQVGLVAQQVAEVFPELVRKDEGTGFLTINYSRLTTHLLVAIKELSELLELQNKKITALEDRIKTPNHNS